MDRTTLVRLRWRLAGAWLWPTFVVLTVVDAAVLHWWPPQGTSESPVFGWIEGTLLMILAICFVAPPMGIVLRRIRRDMPKSVARNYAGTAAILAVSVALGVAGVVHRSGITAQRDAMFDASQRAEAWLGDHAPAQFIDDIHHLDTMVIQAPRLYRSCVANALGSEYYCVVVDRSQPFGTGVRYDGHEPNSLLMQGSN